MPWCWWRNMGNAKTAALMPVADIPTRQECLSLMAEFSMLPHIREHSLVVAEVAAWLGLELQAAGFPLNLPLIEAGALLHDLGKTPCLGTGMNHALWGAERLRDAGFPRVAEVVAEHIILNPAPPDPRPLREAEVVHYADKRVLHTRVVTLAARFADLRERYARTEEARRRLAVLELEAQALEARIFARLPYHPYDLSHLYHTRRQP
jgi:uncharacterized protein